MDASQGERGHGHQFQGAVQRKRILAAHLGVPAQVRDLSTCGWGNLLLFWIQSARSPAEQPASSARRTGKHSWGRAPRKSRIHLPHETRSPSSLARRVPKDRGQQVAGQAGDDVSDHQDRLQCKQRVAVLWVDVQRSLYGCFRHFGMCFHFYI